MTLDACEPGLTPAQPWRWAPPGARRWRPGSQVRPFGPYLNAYHYR